MDSSKSKHVESKKNYSADECIFSHNTIFNQIMDEYRAVQHANPRQCTNCRIVLYWDDKAKCIKFHDPKSKKAMYDLDDFE